MASYKTTQWYKRHAIRAGEQAAGRPQEARQHPHPTPTPNGPALALYGANTRRWPPPGGPSRETAVSRGVTAGAKLRTGGEAPGATEGSAVPPTGNPETVRGERLDTTAQLRQTPPDARTVLRKRARAKGFTVAVVEGLAQLGERTPLRFAYARTLACASDLTQDGGRVTGRYCGNRWCVVCARIRTARQLAAYGPALVSWGDRWFVTLTVPNVGATALHGTVRHVLANVRQAAQNVRRRGVAFKALRKLEVTYNPKRRDFHPHLHLLVDSFAAAQALVAEWLRMHPEASAQAQDVRRGRNAAELLKYAAKLVVKVEGRTTAPPAWALDVIFKALRGLRTVQPMGFKVAGAAVQPEDGDVTLDASTPAPVARTAPTLWRWATALHDWVDADTGELLADFTPTPAHLQLLANIRADAFPPDPPDAG